MKFYKYIILSTLIFLFISCETEVDLDLKIAEPRLVIDASLGNRASCTVKLTMIQDYNDQAAAQTVNGAIITINDGKGNKEKLTNLGEGFYVSRMLGVANKTYTLTVEVEDETYNATETLPAIVPIDSIGLYYFEAGGEAHFFPTVSFIDPVDVVNYYYYDLIINDRYIQGMRVDNDKHSNGKPKNPVLFFDKKENNDEELKVGDKVLIRLQSIDKGTHDFYKSLEAGGGAATTNPTNNFTGDVLGMFKTYSMIYKEMIITEADLEK